MVILHPTISYWHIKTIGIILWVNCFKHFSFRRFIFTVVVMSIVLIIDVVILIGRMLDEILFYGYRKTPIDNPVFIISNPRSGTTYLQKLLASGEEHFYTPKLYQVLLSSITLCRLIDTIGAYEKVLGRPFYRVISWIGGALFGGWKGIHPMGFNKSEEDEGFWFFAFLSPAWAMIVPYFQHLVYLNRLDNFPELEKAKLTNAYYNFIQRLAYNYAGHKRILVKSVMSSGRLRMIQKTFPNASFVYLNRSPQKTVPSYISMFSKPWKWHSPDVGKEAFQSVGQSAIDFYVHSQMIRRELPDKQFLSLEYQGFINHPVETIKNVYAFLGINMNEDDRSRLAEEVKRRKGYKKGHRYSLEDYGYTMEEFEKLLVSE